MGCGSSTSVQVESRTEHAQFKPKKTVIHVDDVSADKDEDLDRCEPQCNKDKENTIDFIDSLKDKDSKRSEPEQDKPKKEVKELYSVLADKDLDRSEPDQHAYTEEVNELNDVLADKDLDRSEPTQEGDKVNEQKAVIPVYDELDSTEQERQENKEAVVLADDVSEDEKDELDWSEPEYDENELEDQQSIVTESGYDEFTIPDEDPREFLPSIGFPTHLTLLEDQQEYTKLKKPGDMDENGCLVPYPCPTLKRDLCHEDMFAAIDKHAVETPESYLHEPMAEVAQYLASICKDDLEKVRAFFRFVTASAHRESATVTASEDTPYWYIKHDSNYYCSLFGKLCDYANIPWKTINCYAKSKDYNAGNALTDDDLSSCSLVLIDKEWRLLDVHWAALHVSGGSSGDWELIDNDGKGAKPVEQSPEQLQYAYNEYYFLTDPHEMIYSHLPKDVQYQLLARPVTLTEFQEMVCARPSFFELNLKVMSHPKCVLEAPIGKTEIQIGLPQGKAREFMYRLWSSTKGKEKSSHGDFKLERFAFMQVNNNTLEIFLEFPVAGRFKFQLFGRNAEEDADGTVYTQVCTYIIDCQKPKEDCEALPENTGAQWGPGPKLEKAGLVALTHTDGIIELQHGVAEIRFQKEKDVDIIHDLKGNNPGKMGNQVIHWHEGNEVVVKMKVPEEGEYALQVYAKETDQEGSYPSVCSYLVTSKQSAFDPDPFPEVTNGRLGCTEKGKAIGLHPKSHPVPYITAPEDGKLNIVFTMDQPLDFTTALEQQTKIENCCFTTQSDTEVSFDISLPDTGLFKFTLYAKLHGEEGPLPSVFQYMIDAKSPNLLHQPFPQTYDKWGTGCHLVDPKSGKLLENCTVPFKLKVPDAQKVAAVVNEDWTQFTLTDDGYWVGDVDTKDAGNELNIGVNSDSESNSYSFVLGYEVVKDKEKRVYAEELEKKKQVAQARMEQEECEKKRQETDFQSIRNALLKSMKGRNIMTIKTAIKTVHDQRFTIRLKQELAQAKQWLASLERIRRLGKAIEKMDKALMSEIRNYREPPAAVHEVMVVCHLLLGENEGRTRIWKECQKLCVTIGPNGLFRKVKNLDIRAMHPEISARGYRILSKLRWDEVADASAGAATIYNWALGVIEEHRTQNPDAKMAQPANLKQQKEIFNAMRQKKK